MNPHAQLYLISNEDEEEENYCFEPKAAVKELMFKGFFCYCPQLAWAEFKRNYKVCATYDVVSCMKYPNHIGCPIYYPNPNYVAHDLHKIEGWMKHDCGMICENNHHSVLFTDERCGICNKFQKVEYYDSGIVGVVLPSAYLYVSEKVDYYDCIIKNATIDDTVFTHLKANWDLKGAEQEYAFMHAHHILVITLETALTIEPSRWEEYAI